MELDRAQMGRQTGASFHVKQPVKCSRLARFTWNNQNADRNFFTQPVQSFHVKRQS
jgi:hypothetical protein